MGGKAIAVAAKFTIPLLETISGIKSVLACPLDPLAYKALGEKLYEDYNLVKDTLGPERVAKINEGAHAIMTAVKEKAGIPHGNTAECK